MRGGDVRRIRTGRESTFAGGLNSSLAGSWLEERMPGKRMPRGSEKKFFADVLAGRLLAMVPENPRKGLVCLLTERRGERGVELAAGPAGTCP